jgi:hypothetical protein
MLEGGILSICSRENLFCSIQDKYISIFIGNHTKIRKVIEECSGFIARELPYMCNVFIIIIIIIIITYYFVYFAVLMCFPPELACNLTSTLCCVCP